jgi:hypothetical protein
MCAVVFPLFDFDFGLDLRLALRFGFLLKPSLLAQIRADCFLWLVVL